MTADQNTSPPTSPATPVPPGSPGSWDGKPLWPADKPQKSGDSESQGTALETVETKKPKSAWQRVRSCLSHLGIILFLGLFTAVGGIAFHEIEHPYEVAKDAEMRSLYLVTRQNIVDSFVELTKNFSASYGYGGDDLIPTELILINGTDSNSSSDSTTTEGYSAEDEQLRGDVNKLLDEFHELLWTVYDEGVILDNETHEWKWTFSSSFFFASTVVTTIGYGNIAPETTWGRVFCIIFALIGIPLTLIAIGDVGRLFATAVQKLGKRLRKCICFKKKKDKEKSDDDDDEDSPSMGKTWLKVFWAIMLLLLYISFGAALFMIWEDWEFFDSFYFCFITMTTIGLGDIVPEHQMFMLLCTLYILIGLAVTSTCIELARSEYEKSWQRMLEASRKLHISGSLLDTLKKLNEQIETHGGIVDLSVISDLRSALKESGIEDMNPPSAPQTPPLYVIYESSV